jgi:hypothetical protein
MPNPFTTIPTVLKYMSMVWSWPLRFYYTSGKLDPFLIFDVPSTGEQLHIIIPLKKRIAG